MIARVRSDGKAEFLMEYHELLVLEALLMQGSLVIPNQVTRAVCNQMRMDMNGGIMTVQIAMRNPAAALVGIEKMKQIERKVVKEAEERVAVHARTSSQPIEPKPVINTTMGDKLKAALGGPDAQAADPASSTPPATQS